MSDINQVREAVYQRFVDEWISGPNKLTAYVFDNEVFDPDGGLDGYGKPWARISMRTLDRRQHTLGKSGNRKFKTTAQVNLQIFVPLNTGAKTTDTLLKAGVNLYEGRSLSLSDVDIWEVIPREIGPDPAGRPYWASTVTARLEYTEIK